jgi:hypothetical protein
MLLYLNFTLSGFTVATLALAMYRTKKSTVPLYCLLQLALCLLGLPLGCGQLIKDENITRFNRERFISAKIGWNCSTVTPRYRPSLPGSA